MAKKTPILDIPTTVRHYLSYENKVRQSFGMDKYDDLLLPDDFAVLSNEGGLKSGASIKTDHFALIVCLKGTCTKTVGPFTFNVSPRSLHIISPKHFNSYDHASDDLLLYMILFRKEFLSKSFIKELILDNLLELNPDLPPVFYLDEPSFEGIKGFFEKINREYHEQHSSYLQVIRLLIVELLYAINRVNEAGEGYSNKQLSRQHRLLTAFRKLVDEHFVTLRTVQEYADQLHISAKYLSEISREETGKTALAIIHKRIYLEAQYLLSSTSLSIKEVADKLNFDTSSHFSRFFRNFSGANPSTFKKELTDKAS